MITISLKFDQSKVDKAQEDYKKLDVSPEQRHLIDQIAAMMEKFLPIPIMAIKGNTWFTIKQWQLENHRTIADIARMNPKERLETAKELFRLGKEKTMRMLMNPEEQKHILDEVYDKAWNVYEQYTKQS